MLQTIKFITSHPMNRDRKFASVMRFFWWQLESRMRNEVPFDWIEGSRLIVKNGMTGATGNIYCGLHEYDDKAFFLHAVRKGDIFLDIGANIGSYSVLAGKVCGAKLIAFEPEASTADSFIKNMTANDISDFDLHQVALGPENGTIEFTVGLDTVNKVSQGSDGPTQTVPMRKLDDIPGATNATFIKMDVEGFEESVLRGAEAVLASESLIALQTECDDPDVEEILVKAGLSRYYYDADSRTLSHEPINSNKAANALFVKDMDRLQSRISSAPYRQFRGRTF